jgi:signal transduction histidine kinase/DNA-binding NarL/FixJ family response regulator
VQGRVLRRDEAWRRVFYDASAGIIGRAGGIEEATRLMRRRAKTMVPADPLLPSGEIGAVAPFAVSGQPALREAIERLYAGPDSHFLNFYGPAGTIRHISYSRLVTPASRSPPADENIDLEGVAVFVGSSELDKPVQADHFRTVYTREDGVEMSGAEVAATAYANLLTATTLRPASPLTALGLLAALGIVFTVCAYSLPPRVATPSTVALALAYGMVAVGLFARSHIWLPLAIPLLLTLPAALIVGTGGQVLLAWRQRRRAESAEKAAVAASAAKSAFLATMSHEIRTLLSWVTGLVERLDRADLDDVERGLVARVRHFSDTLLKLLNDVLDVAKMEAGALQLAPEAVALRPLLQAVVDMHRPAAEAKGLGLSLQIAEGVPPVVLADPLRLCQILWNLAGNAVKFTEQGQVVARLDIEGEMARDRLLLRLSVADTGIGIPEEVQAALFQPFRQADASTARRFGGSGLGLSIARQLTEAMGGTITLRSRPGQGSTFTVRLPVTVVAAPAEPPRPAQPLPGLADHAPRVLAAGPSSQLLSGESAPGAAGEVLVAEDDPLNRLLIEGQLKTLGLAPRLCGDGEEAWMSLRQRPARLLITDHHMPQGLGGIELTRRIRADERYAGVRIIGLTADAGPDAIQACLDAGMDLVLIKPLRLPDLPDALLRLGIPFGVPGPAGATHRVAGRDERREEEAAATFDPGNLVRAFGGLDEQARRLLADYLARTATAVAEAKSLAASRNAVALRQLTHRMAGSSASMGATRLGRLFNELAAAATIPDWTRVDALAALLDQHLADAAGAVAEYLGDGDRGVVSARQAGTRRSAPS